ncbi:Crp/Fnr family transcriptional regulator [Pleurocapsa sp. PCC 7319]|uniref:Crp/Fnr family transcriptional regulator n=1 Tax=Pleurocapsa sp. PCC 7319 TaxID=118161 RepID=UPI00034C45AC|nr:Crp/Fnr family transcriptional regulator [Pleurocapsa sp. PCC 7319]
MQSLVYEQTTSFFNSGDELPKTSGYIWLIVAGVVKTYTVSESGIWITLGFWGKQDVVGQPLSCVNPYFLKCMSDVTTKAIPRSQWRTFSQEFFYHAQQTQQLLFIVRNTRIAKRLWLLLKWLANKFGRVVQQGKLIDFKITHQELADAIGTTRITVTKILNQFEREGLILRPKTKCIILKQ